MAEAELLLGDKKIMLPIIEGSEGEKAIDISKLRAQTGFVTLDNGYVNTGSCESTITFINGEEGILRYRGYSIADVCQNLDFLETSYLVIYGELPSQEQYDNFCRDINENMVLDPAIFALMKTFPKVAHPMAELISAASSLSAIYPYDTESKEETEKAIVQYLAKMPSLAAGIYRIRKGLPVVAPDPTLSYAANFLHMMFQDTDADHSRDADVVKALDMLLMLHVDHEQNCSTATVRVAGSSHVDLYASCVSGMAALWGPLHGGANQAVIEMLNQIHADGNDLDKYIAKAKDKDDSFRLMGFGHRVYKNTDPRANIISQHSDQVLEKLNVEDPLLDLARNLESVARGDDYFVSRKLFPNVDFYSGILYKALQIPTDMFTVMFALGRLPGWIGQWRELKADPMLRIGRPRQIYQGYTQRSVAAKVTRHH